MARQKGGSVIAGHHRTHLAVQAPLVKFASATQRRELLQAFGTRAVYTTCLAPRNSARCSIVSLILNETSLPPGAPGSAWTEWIRSFSFLLSICGSTLPMNRSPQRIGST